MVSRHSPPAVLVEPRVAARGPLLRLRRPGTGPGASPAGTGTRPAGTSRSRRRCPQPARGSPCARRGGQARDLAQRHALQQLAHGLPHDGIHDVGGRVEDAAGLAHLRLLLHLGPVPGGQADHLAQELLVDLAQDVGRQHGELVGAVGVVEALEDVLAATLSSIARPGRQRVRRLARGPFRPRSGTGRSCSAASACRKQLAAAARRRSAPLTSAQQRAVRLDAAVLADAQEDDAVDGLLDGEVELALAQGRVAQREVARQQVAPALDLGQERVVHLGGAALARLAPRRTCRTSP